MSQKTSFQILTRLQPKLDNLHLALKEAEQAMRRLNVQRLEPLAEGLDELASDAFHMQQKLHEMRQKEVSLRKRR